jgi:two-component system response regulator (stage 0 sporulation protein F)
MSESLGHLLIVDDEAPVLDVLSEYFATQGYTVDTAANGADALSAVERLHPDLVLLDVRMPGMDGLEVLRKLRELDQRLAVIMVTANEDVALARETLKIGAFDYVSKPFDFRYLDRAVAAGLVQTGGLVLGGGASKPTEDPWRRLTFAIFGTVRAMSAAGRSSVGERLETAVLACVREVNAGRRGGAAPWLAEIELLLAIASDLGDLPLATRTSIESALGSARQALDRG